MNQPDSAQCLAILRQMVDMIESGRARLENFTVRIDESGGARDMRSITGRVYATRVESQSFDFEVSVSEEPRALRSQDEASGESAGFVTIEDTSGRRQRLTVRPMKDLMARIANHITCVLGQDLDVTKIEMPLTAYDEIKARAPWIVEQSGNYNIMGKSVMIIPDGQWGQPLRAMRTPIDDPPRGKPKPKTVEQPNKRVQGARDLILD